MNQNPTSNRLLKRMPTKWGLVLGLALLGYALLQPTINHRLGLSLPSVVDLIGQSDESLPTESVHQNPSRVPSTDESLSRGGAEPLHYGLLRELSDQDFVSPVGLIYGRGSAEGHRLEHLKRHLKDLPDRPGKHGVFYGEMAQVLRWLDEAYMRGEAGKEGATRSEERGRTVYAVPFDQPIGFVGGRDGSRRGNPDARKLKLVVEGKRVITAFPF